MKILVLGGTGMAGHTISIYLKEAGHDLTTLSRRKFEYCNNIVRDVTDFDYLKMIIKEGKYDAIINAIGILNQDAENEKHMAVLLNSYLPHYLSYITKNMNTKIIHISTDCVFSGKDGKYMENSLKDGETFYDRSKALGEIVNEKDLTFRNSIIGPDINENGIGLVNWFMNQKCEVNGFTKVIWTGITTITLAKAIECSLYENITGVYNLVNNVSISKFELLNLLNKHMKDSKIKIKPYNEIISNKSLVNNRNDLSFTVPSYEEMVIEMKEWIKKHRQFYPSYYN